jgi:hypothetical protein
METFEPYTHFIPALSAREAFEGLSEVDIRFMNDEEKYWLTNLAKAGKSLTRPVMIEL